MAIYGGTQMKLIINSKIHIQDINQKVLEYCNKELFFPNPKVQRMKAMGFWTRKSSEKHKTIY